MQQQDVERIVAEMLRRLAPGGVSGFATDGAQPRASVSGDDGICETLDAGLTLIENAP